MDDNHKTVLILDNEYPVSWALKSILGMENYQVFTAATLDEFNKLMPDSGFSALITEYRLDRDSTLNTIKGLKKSQPDLYVMMLTNNEVNEKEYAEIIRSGVDDYFLKPFSFNRILLHLEKGLNRERIGSSNEQDA
jgi:DNA-binding NtrC family response regulator